MLRGAIIGLGNVAVRGHVPAYLSGRTGARAAIAAVMDVAEENRAQARKLLPGAAVYASIDELLAHEKLDFADICTPPHTHSAIIGACASRGVHVLCEKPLAQNHADAEAAGKVVRDAGIVYVPCHQYKYSPLWKTIREICAAGRIGQVTLAQCSVYRLQADTGSAGWSPAWRTDKKQSGGGILVDTGAHYFYLAQYFFGLPSGISACLRTLKHASYGVEDTALVTLEYPHTLMQINLTWAAGQRANSAVFAGTEGILAYDGVRLLLTTSAGSEEIPMPNISDKNQYVAWYEALFGEFFSRIESGNCATDLLGESLHVMNMLRLSVESSERGCAVEYR